jgi:hypothetical protein
MPGLEPPVPPVPPVLLVPGMRPPESAAKGVLGLLAVRAKPEYW